MAIGLGGAIAPPPIFCQPKKLKLEITTYKLAYINKAKKAHWIL